MIEITGPKGKSEIVRKILTERSMLVCLDTSAVMAFSHTPCNIWVPFPETGVKYNLNAIFEHIASEPTAYDQVVVYTNYTIDQVKDIRDAIVRAEDIYLPVFILAWKGS